MSAVALAGPGLPRSLLPGREFDPLPDGGTCPLCRDSGRLIGWLSFPFPVPGRWLVVDADLRSGCGALYLNPSRRFPCRFAEDNRICIRGDLGGTAGGISSTGSGISSTLTSRETCCSGALFDRSWMGNRPGMVAAARPMVVSLMTIKCCRSALVPLTGIHAVVRHAPRGHQVQFRHAGFSPGRERFWLH